MQVDGASSGEALDADLRDRVRTSHDDSEVDRLLSAFEEFMNAR